MSWKRSDDQPATADTYWRSAGCGCCSRLYGMDNSEFAAYEVLTSDKAKEILEDLKKHYELAKADYEIIKRREGEEESKHL